MNFLNQISRGDFAWDDSVWDYITDYDYDMKSVRGLIASLLLKSVISYEENSGIMDEKGREMAIAKIKDRFLDWDNNKLKNIGVA